MKLEDTIVRFKQSKGYETGTRRNLAEEYLKDFKDPKEEKYPLTTDKAPIVTNPGISKDYTWTFHKPIGDYVKAARGAGLLVDSIEEWPSHKTSDSGPRAAAENTARKEIPMFLALRVVNIGKPEAIEEEATNE